VAKIYFTSGIKQWLMNGLKQHLVPGHAVRGHAWVVRVGVWMVG